MEGLQTFLGPLVGHWAIHNAILYSAGIVNRMREMVITGVDGNATLTARHRKASLVDWVLCMLAKVTVSLLDAGILIGVSPGVGEVAKIAWALELVASYPLVCSLLFVACSI